MISADEFDDWCEYHKVYPIDDQSNFHVPVASLHASFINANRADNSQPVGLADCLVFRNQKDQHIDELLLSEDW